MTFSKRLGLAPLILAALVAAPLSASAQDVGADWLKKPTQGDLVAVWPTQAMKKGKGGKALIACIVTAQGGLRDCRAVEESPLGAGFGAAGVTISAQFLMRPATHDGKPIESQVRIPLHWPDMPVRTGSYLNRREAPEDLRPDKVVSNVRWKHAPSFRDVLANYPEKARAAQVSGRATLDCVFNRDGGLSRCDVLQEFPKSQGFGSAARKLSPMFVGPTTDNSGASLAGVHVQLPFVFAAESLASAAPLIGRPQWASLPTGDDLVAAYPKDALKAGVMKARVVLSCTVVADGALSDCKVDSEDPAGYGMGKATLQLVPAFRLGIWTPEGLPSLGGVVRVPIRYDFSAELPPAKP